METSENQNQMLQQGIKRKYWKNINRKYCYIGTGIEWVKWDRVFKNGPSKICGRQPVKNLRGYGLPKQTIPLQTF